MRSGLSAVESRRTAADCYELVRRRRDCLDGHSVQLAESLTVSGLQAVAAGAFDVPDSTGCWGSATGRLTTRRSPSHSGRPGCTRTNVSCTQQTVRLLVIHRKNIRISIRIFRGEFATFTESLPYTFVSVNRRNNIARARIAMSIYGYGTAVPLKYRKLAAVDIRILLQCMLYSVRRSFTTLTFLFSTAPSQRYRYSFITRFRISHPLYIQGRGQGFWGGLWGGVWAPHLFRSIWSWGFCSQKMFGIWRLKFQIGRFWCILTAIGLTRPMYCITSWWLSIYIQEHYQKLLVTWCVSCKSHWWPWWQAEYSNSSSVPVGLTPACISLYMLNLRKFLGPFHRAIVGP